MVQYWVDQKLRSERQGCRLMGVSRSTVRYQASGRDDLALRRRLKELAEKYPRYGYPTLHDMLRMEGMVKNRKRTYRIYSEEGLQVRQKKTQEAHSAANTHGVGDSSEREMVYRFCQRSIVYRTSISGVQYHRRFHTRMRGSVD